MARREEESLRHTVAREEHALVGALREGDEASFGVFVERHSPSMLRIASMYVPSRAIAEEVVQEAWLAVLDGIDRFQERSSLKTWIFRILTNIAKTRGTRESRSVPFSSLAAQDVSRVERAVDPDRFNPPSHESEPGAWAAPPSRWDVPEERLLLKEARAVVEHAIAELPEAQRTVITLRDVDGWSAVEVCNALGIAETNQRVLLHRARSRVRHAVERYMDEGPDR